MGKGSEEGEDRETEREEGRTEGHGAGERKRGARERHRKRNGKRGRRWRGREGRLGDKERDFGRCKRGETGRESPVTVNLWRWNVHWRREDEIGRGSLCPKPKLPIPMMLNFLIASRSSGIHLMAVLSGRRRIRGWEAGGHHHIAKMKDFPKHPLSSAYPARWVQVPTSNTCQMITLLMNT